MAVLAQVNTPGQTRVTVEAEIRKAFRGVTLGQGMSIRQAQLADGFQDTVRSGHPSPARDEITDDWSQVTLSELERDCVAHLDALGFRYYVPALMLSVISHYDPSSMRVIGTLGGLYPKKDSWEYDMNRYSLLDAAQKRAIAQFLAELPKLVPLESDDQKIVQRALRNYWGQHMHATTTE